MPEKDIAKPQPTLTGYTAWAFRRLVAAQGEGEGPVAKWIIDRWVEDNRGLLAEKYDIKREQYESRKKVQRLDSRR
jgi:hypothetical protein